MLNAASTILLDGFAFAIVLFLISAGLSLTMGLMGFANLAHTAFAMAGGYISAALGNQFGVPFLATLPIAFVTVAIASVAFERVLYRPLYQASELDQVLMTFGLILMSVAVAIYFFGPLPPTTRIPHFLSGQVSLGFRDFPTYRLFLIGVGLALSLALWIGLERTQFGRSIRASVDNRKMAESVGINVDRLFVMAFALGSGLAALGGALGNQLLPLSPTYAFEYLVIVLIVVSVGGMGSLKGTFVAALLIGIVDTAGKYLLPDVGGFVVYLLTLAVLLVRPQGLFGVQASAAHASASLAGPGPQRRWGVLDVLPWLVAISLYFLMGNNLSFLTHILIAILFVISLDLVMGYAGVLTIGQAAFFGLGAYASGILSARYGISDPILGLLFGAALAAIGGFLSGWVLLRTRGLALLMLTLAVTQMLHEATAKTIWLTGGHDGLLGVQRAPLFGFVSFDFTGKTMFWYALGVLFIVFVLARRLVQSQFGIALQGIRENPTRMTAIGSSVHLRLVVVYTIAAAFAGMAGALTSQATRLASLDMISFERSASAIVMLILGGLGTLYGAFIGPAVYISFEHYLARLSPEYWYFWVGMFLILRTLLLPSGLYGFILDLAAWVQRGIRRRHSVGVPK